MPEVMTPPTIGAAIRFIIAPQTKRRSSVGLERQRRFKADSGIIGRRIKDLPVMKRAYNKLLSAWCNEEIAALQQKAQIASGFSPFGS
jgi:hypothetical protein